jgi:hypothetical protein
MNRQSSASIFNNGVCIINSYATGNVKGTERVGGLVGWNHNDAEITNSYSVGEVEGETAVGAFAGTNNGTITSSYALDKGVIFINNNWNITCGNSGLKIVAQMRQQTTFVGWSFGTVWGISAGRNDGFPFLVAVGN